MKPSKYLGNIRKKATARLIRLKIFANDAANLTWVESDKIISFATIESLNTWRNFARSYFLSCILHPWRECGRQIRLSNKSILTYDDALKVAMKICKPQIFKKGSWGGKDEPAWHYPNTFIKCCNEIGCSNQSDILNAFSFKSYVFNDLPMFRNFYAHRSRYTAGIARHLASKYSIPMYNHPTEILCNSAYGRPQILLTDWIDDIKNTIELLCA